MNPFKTILCLLNFLPLIVTAQDTCPCSEARKLNVNGMDTCVHILKFGRLQTSAWTYCHHTLAERVNTDSLQHFDYLYVHCNSGDTTADEIIRKIEAGQPTEHFRIDTLKGSNSALIHLPKENCEQITVSVKTLGQQEVTLILGTDYSFDCETYELKFINSALLDSGVIIKVNWFYRNCSTDN